MIGRPASHRLEQHDAEPLLDRDRGQHQEVGFSHAARQVLVGILAEPLHPVRERQGLSERCEAVALRDLRQRYPA
jgi:hypothetical protein